MREHLAGLRCDIVDEAAAAGLQTSLNLSESAVRKALREIGFPMTPLVEGVRQDSFGELERTLLALLAEYGAGDSERRRACRREVIRAKDHARLALAREAGEARERRTEMILWMMTWLENPGVFADWLALRKRALDATQS